MNKRENYKKIFYSKEVERYARIICDIAKEAWNLKLADTTGFSISQRIPNTDIVLVDKSGTGFRRNKINESDLLLINLKGDMLYQPSKTNPRKAPVNIEIHLAGYRNSRANGCVHWHDPYTNAFACLGEPISPFTLQSKLIGIVPCVLVDDRKEKESIKNNIEKINVPSGLHSRPDVFYVMEKVGKEAGKILHERNLEFDSHGVVITHYEHGLFAFGRDVEEAFENGYRSVRNAQTIIYSELLKNRFNKNKS